MASLLVVAGPSEGQYYPLGRRTMVIGRCESAPIQVVDDRVSRKHVQVRFDETDGTHHALDLKSANGTWINGRKLEGDVILMDNDTIEIGESKVVYLKQDFPDRESALNLYKQRGQRGQSTISR